MEHLELSGLWEERWTPPLKDEQTLSPWQKLGVTFLRKVKESYKYGLGIGNVRQAD